MNEQAIRFRIGIFVLAGLIALGVLVILFGGRPYYFLPQTTYTIQFDNAQGVAAGTPVKRSGVKIGEVRRVSLDDDTGRVEVLIQIDDGYKLRKGDKATLTQSLLGGDASIAFLPPTKKEDIDTTPVEAGAVLEGVSQADAGTLLQRTTDVIHPAEEALREIKKSLERLTPGAEDALREIRIAVPKTSDTIQDTAKKLTPSVERMLEKIDKALPVIERAFDKIDKLAPGIEKAVDEFRDTVKRLGPGAERVFEKIDKLAPVVERAFDKIDKMAPEVEKTVTEFRKTLDEFQILARSWNKVGERFDLFMRTNEDKLVKAIERTDEVLKRVNEVFSDENQKNIRDVLKNVRIASDRFDAIARNADDMIKETRATLKTFHDSLVKVDKMVVDLQKVTKPLADRGESIMKNVDESTDKLNRTMTDLRDLIQSVARGEGTIQKLLSDPALYNNLNQASLSLSRIMPRMDHILRDVEIFADKIARHPESLGIGGVVRPGSGVKGSPTPYNVFPTYP